MAEHTSLTPDPDLPDGVDLRGSETFDPALMQRLYDLGYQAAREGPDWRTRPPAVFVADD